MKLIGITENISIAGPLLILEAGYGRVLSFRYDGFGTDPSPKVLYLGKYKHPKTGKMLYGGVNLNYLSKDQIQKLRMGLRDILRSGRRLKQRWAKGNELFPDIFPNQGGRANRGAYRTYDSDLVHITDKGTLAPIDVSEPERKPSPKRKRRKKKLPTAPVRRKLTKPTKPKVAAEPREPREPEAPTRASRKSSEKTVTRQKEGEAADVEPRISELEKAPSIEPSADTGEVDPSPEPRRSSEKMVTPDVETDGDGRAVDLTDRNKKSGIGPKARERKAEKESNEDSI